MDFVDFLRASGPTQCNRCNEKDAEKCSENQDNQTCASHEDSLDTTHCGSVVGKYRDNGKEEARVTGACFNCAGKLNLPQMFANIIRC